jgi:hypothetical protein
VLVSHLEIASRSAGAEIYSDTSRDFSVGTGISPYLPAEANLQNHPVTDALNVASLLPVITHLNGTLLGIQVIRLDIQNIVVGKRFPGLLRCHLSQMA